MTDFSEYPTVTLAGTHYPVKPLVVKQMRVVVPAMMRLQSLKLSTITEDQITDLVEICYQAVCPCQDKLTRDDFTNLPITPWELLDALPIIASQTGMLKKDAAPGEAPAGNQSTGTPSSAA